jgi:hypothetical protein
MYLEYEEKEEKYLFRHWLTHKMQAYKDNFWYIDVNQWVIDEFGPIGGKWGWDKQHITGPSGHNLTNITAIISYCWRFKDKADAMHFKLRWFSQD